MFPSRRLGRSPWRSMCPGPSARPRVAFRFVCRSWVDSNRAGRLFDPPDDFNVFNVQSVDPASPAIFQPWGDSRTEVPKGPETWTSPAARGRTLRGRVRDRLPRLHDAGGSRRRHGGPTKSPQQPLGIGQMPPGTIAPLDQDSRRTEPEPARARSSGAWPGATRRGVVSLVRGAGRADGVGGG